MAKKPKINVKTRDIDKGWKALTQNIKGVSGSFVKVGVQTGDSNEGISVAVYAAYNEFGTSTIPSRPFMRTTYEKSFNDLAKIVDKFTGQIIDRTKTSSAALDQIGMWYASQIQKTIRTYAFAPNAPSTVALKGFNAPLRDTRTLIQSIRHVVIN